MRGVQDPSCKASTERDQPFVQLELSEVLAGSDRIQPVFWQVAVLSTQVGHRSWGATPTVKTTSAKGSRQPLRSVPEFSILGPLH